MVRRHFEVVIVGLGAMGSAALYHLSKSGVPVLGLEQFKSPHALGSSHGETRVIREAYFEDPIYVPVVQRAYELWERLSSEASVQLYLKTSGLMIGPRGSTVADGALCSAQEHNLPHQILDAGNIRKRYPGLNPKDDMIGILEPRAGILFPEKCIEAHLLLARSHGAHIAMEEKVLEWTTDKKLIRVVTDAQSYTCSRLIIAAGAWVGSLASKLGIRFEIERQVLHWFKPQKPELYGAQSFPIHLWEYEPGRMFYGFPDLGSGLKVALHHQGENVDPENLDRIIRPEDITVMRGLLERFLPEANGEYLRGTVCMYTNTPDGHFILDRHPENPNVIIASPCSGHGFKFASAIGEVLRDMALDRGAKWDLNLFSLRRFGSLLP
jgi:sarcosine oxidase